MKKFKGSFILLITAVIWGLAFVAQTTAADNVGPFTFNTARSALAAAFLLIAILLRNTRRRASKKESSPAVFRKTLTGGIVCGVTLFIGVSLQQYGIAAYPPEAAASGRAGFLTATYVVMIPIVRRLTGKKLGLPVILAVIGCIAGMYLLCMSGGFGGIYLGDLLELGCAAGFTSYILAVDRYSGLDGLMISFLQFTVCGLISAVCMLICESPDIRVIADAWLPIVYAGVVSSGIGYTLQIIGQRSTDPAVASIIMSMESVFAAAAGWLILGEALSPRELLGCALVFASVIAAQLPDMISARKASAQNNTSRH